MTSADLDRARVYAEALVTRSEWLGLGSLADLKLILQAIHELQAIRAMPAARADQKGELAA